jgi:hypothetical protein
MTDYTELLLYEAAVSLTMAGITVAIPKAYNGKKNLLS